MAEAAVRRSAAHSVRVALLMALSLCCARAAAGVGHAMSLFPVVSLALAVKPQLTMRRRVAFLQAREALAFAIRVTLSATGSPLCQAGPIPSTCNMQTARDQMQHKLRTETGKAIYARRKAIVEAPFGSIKEVQGMRRFLLRGLNKVQGEWNLATACHNVLKLFRHGKQAAIEALKQQPQATSRLIGQPFQVVTAH